MHFQQVALALMSFSSARGGSLQGGLHSGYTIVPPTGASRIVVDRDRLNSDTWYVRFERKSQTNRRVLHDEPPVHFPAVTNVEDLHTMLARAWSFHELDAANDMIRPPFPILSRFIDPPRSNSPPRKSPSPRRANVMPKPLQTS